MYFNKQKDRMVEVLQNYRAFFYKKVDLPGKPNQVHWELIRRIDDYPSEFDAMGIDCFFSPCFSRYVCTDKRTKQFVIKDAYTQDKIVSVIPTELLTFDVVENAQQTLNRTKWIDINTILIINEEGIEKLIDLDKDFKEIEFNFRPLFTGIAKDSEEPPEDGSSSEEKEYEQYAYYHKRRPLNLKACLPRL